jgi:hypothetical protein
LESIRFFGSSIIKVQFYGEVIEACSVTECL